MAEEEEEEEDEDDEDDDDDEEDEDEDDMVAGEAAEAPPLRARDSAENGPQFQPGVPRDLGSAALPSSTPFEPASAAPVRGS